MIFVHVYLYINEDIRILVQHDKCQRINAKPASYCSNAKYVMHAVTHRQMDFIKNIASKSY